MVKYGVGFLEDQSFVKTSDSCVTNGARFAFKGGVLGTALTIFQAQHQVGVIGFPEIVGQGMIRNILPGAMAGAVFGSTTCILDNVRGKDSPISNAFLGGLAAGLVVGSKSRNPWKGFQIGLAFGTVGAVLRCFAVEALIRTNPEGELDRLNNTLYLPEIKHLAPKQD